MRVYIFSLDLFHYRFCGTILSLVDDVPVDNEEHIVISSILRSVSPTSFLEMFIEVSVCARVFIG